jgi:DNA polymerase
VTPDPELAKWLRYYRDLGFTHLYGRAPAATQQDVPASAQAAVPAAAPSPRPTDSVAPSIAQAIRHPARPPAPSHATAPSGLFAATAVSETLEQVRDDLGDCRRCKLCEGRKSIVFGSGNPKAELVFVGEGPGADEDEQGLPFVGRAGQLLTDMIEKGLKIPRPDVYICNIVKCRPPGNRKPERDEVAACRQFVERQIDAIRPRAICALGATAAETLLDVRESMGRLRGRWYEFHGFPLIVTYHPAFLLRDPSRKAETWEDLKLILARLRSTAPADSGG